MNGPYSLSITATDITITNVVAAAYTSSTLIISNAAANAVTINWAAPGRAIGIGTSSQVSLPSGKVVAIIINAFYPGLLTYATQLEQTTTPLTSDIIPELLYYKMTESNQTTPPIYLTDSSKHGGITGTLTSGYVVAWVPNQTATAFTAIHFNGNSTALDTHDGTDFNFTTNLFTINMWVRPLTYNCQLAGNGQYLVSGWYFVVNQVGAVLLAAENSGTDNYVATGASVALVGQWSMLTAVRTNTTSVLIYKNGVQQPTIGSFTNPASCGASLVFGVYPGGGYYYDGDIGVVRIYNRPLSPGEIGTLYTNGITGATP